MCSAGEANSRVWAFKFTLGTWDSFCVGFIPKTQSALSFSILAEGKFESTVLLSEWCITTVQRVGLPIPSTTKHYNQMYPTSVNSESILYDLLFRFADLPFPSDLNRLLYNRPTRLPWSYIFVDFYILYFNGSMSMFKGMMPTAPVIAKMVRGEPVVSLDGHVLSAASTTTEFDRIAFSGRRLPVSIKNASFIDIETYFNITFTLSKKLILGQGAQKLSSDNLILKIHVGSEVIDFLASTFNFNLTIQVNWKPSFAGGFIHHNLDAPVSPFGLQYLDAFNYRDVLKGSVVFVSPFQATPSSDKQLTLTAAIYDSLLFSFSTTVSGNKPDSIAQLPMNMSYTACWDSQRSNYEYELSLSDFPSPPIASSAANVVYWIHKAIPVSMGIIMKDFFIELHVGSYFTQEDVHRGRLKFIARESVRGSSITVSLAFSVTTHNLTVAVQSGTFVLIDGCERFYALCA